MNRLISHVPVRAVGVLLALRPALCFTASWLFLTCAAQLPPARAQDLDDVTLSGAVTDEHGARVAGATVTAVLTATKAERTVVTDGEGRYRLVELQPGAYAVRVTRAGFAAEERADISTLAGQHVRLDFTLRAAGPELAETVVSASDVSPVDVTRVVAGGAVGREELERLASASRSALDFVFLLGGVTEEPLPSLYSEILYVYETKVSVYGREARAHTEKLYVHGRRQYS